MRIVVARVTRVVQVVEESSKIQKHELVESLTQVHGEVIEVHQKVGLDKMVVHDPFCTSDVSYL